MDRVKITMEYIFRASPTIVYKFLTTPDCLIRWFCEEVHIQGTTYSFFWSGAEEQAEVIESEEDIFIRFQWEDSEDDEFFEYQLARSPVTGETILTITDYADEDEVGDQRQLWDSQMKQMQKEMGG